MDPSDLSSLNGGLLGDLDSPMKMSDAGMLKLVFRIQLDYHSIGAWIRSIYRLIVSHYKHTVCVNLIVLIERLFLNKHNLCFFIFSSLSF
jgi:hypothetical protein